VTHVRVLFFKGTGDDTDVILREVIETVKKGDKLTIGYDPARGQDNPSYKKIQEL
jgi:hypothetical protein